MQEKIILFPTTKTRLEDEIEDLMEQQNYEAALKKLRHLFVCGSHSYSQHVQILICLVKLQRLTEARDFCETLLTDPHAPHFYDYLDYYVMILYEKKHFTEVMAVLNEEEMRQDFPEEYKVKFMEIKRMAKEMISFQAMDVAQSFQQAVLDDLPNKQYYLLQKWLQLDVKTPASFYSLLKEETVHPVIKTIIFSRLQKEQLMESVTIQKCNQQMTVVPAQMPEMEKQPFYEKTIACFNDIEQHDPSLYQVARELFQQYCWVKYPFLYKIEETQTMADALIECAKGLLYGEGQSSNHEGIREIMQCQRLYQDIMIQ